MIFSKFPSYSVETPLEPESLEAVSFQPSAMMAQAGDREITYQLQTLYKNGAYNSTIRLDYIQPIFDYMAETKAIRFRRVTRGARLIIEQSNRSKGTSIFAWANGNKISLSPDANFSRSVYTTAVVFCHEFLHCAGGGAHSKKPEPLMSFNGGTTGGFLGDDDPWWRVYPWRGSARPEVGGLRKRFGGVQLTAAEASAERIFRSGGCGCETTFLERIFGVSAP